MSSTQTESPQWHVTQQHGDLQVLRCGRNLKILLKRPNNGNALTANMVDQVTECFRKASHDDSVARIVITADGKFFCTGMDLGKSSTAVGKQQDVSSDAYRKFTELFEAIESSPKVTIACINGPCYAGGVGLAFACDVRLSVSSASVTLSEVRLGLCPAIISKCLVREWGPAVTREAMLSGRTIPMAELRQLGAVHGLADDKNGLEKLLTSYILDLKKCAPGASAMCKEVVRAGCLHAGRPEQDEVIKEIFSRMMAPDAESAIGLRNFQARKKSTDWDSMYIKPSKL